ncbi:NADH-FMN oxidoreductase RutF, flavin reductase (DIM6/NTAB) family [Arthrobacter sp. yr096]|uniref:flavin reductase n=1 Tax=Arthrobacter sp. yr096 TaxID=1761750 RepID=UPI0008D710AA|nr:flavin reductase [Arthrobacter sp. yr096]SEJ50683.1 NADH-FMN oxidoreductase RutF, flavin reductase (DIM6/NTAB) family [Arthrobacter sp. yr096]
MRKIAIVGAGESGAQLALGLQRDGYAVTLLSDRSAAQIRTGKVMSSQCMFSTALDAEAHLGTALTEFYDSGSVPDINSIRLRVEAEEPIEWQAPLDGPARSIDQRIKSALWIETFVAGGGDFRIEKVTPRMLEELARDYELVIVSTGKGEIGQIFPRDKAKSPFDRPQRVLALNYVTSSSSTEPEGDAIRMSMAPGVGEFFTFPGLTVSGPCRMMVFEGVVGGPMDRWTDVGSPEEQLERSLEILRDHFPHETENFVGAELTDSGATLLGRITPTVRSAVGELDNGKLVFGLGDAVVLNDPLTGQGSNNATLAAKYYLDSIVRRGQQPFDRAWMERTFDEFWRGWGQWAVEWTNDLLKPRRDHQQTLLREAAGHPALAASIVGGFDDPRTSYPWWFDPTAAADFMQARKEDDTAVFDIRDFRGALGQFATGVTVVTTVAADGRKVGMTANSFTSVSMEPPLVLWCPSKRAPSLGDFEDATHFAINILASDQHVLSRQFATPATDKFAGAETTEGIAGVPLLDGAVATFQCRTVSRHDAGDHVIYVGEVESYSYDGGAPLVFHAGKYHATASHPDF